MSKDDVKPTVNGSAENGHAKRFAFVNCEDAAKWNDLFDGYWKPFLGEKSDNWIEFKAYKEEFPDLQQHWDGFVIPGSHHTTYLNKEYPWIGKLHEWIQQLRAHQKKLAEKKLRVPRLMGVCFGHQSIAHALGGQTAQNPTKEFILGTEDITVTEHFHSLAKSLGIETCKSCSNGCHAEEKVPQQQQQQQQQQLSSIRMLESHGDQVLKLPDDGVPLGSSKSSKFESYVIGQDVLGTQFHPEFKPKTITEKIMPALLESKRISQGQAELTVKNCEQPISAELMTNLLRKWFRND
jgi:GMP synthase-like glutamine amidotransferase